MFIILQHLPTPPPSADHSLVSPGGGEWGHSQLWSVVSALSDSAADNNKHTDTHCCRYGITKQEQEELAVISAIFMSKMSETKRRAEMSLEDQFSYAFGLSVIITGEYLILREPHLFTYFYAFLLSVLVTKRYLFRETCCHLLFHFPQVSRVPG